MTKRNSQPENAELHEFKKNLFADAERLIKDDFPKKVLLYNDFLNSPRLSCDRLKEIIPGMELNIPAPSVDKGVVSLEAPSAKKRRTSVSHDDEPKGVIQKQLTLNGSPVIAFVNGTVPCNSHLTLLMDEVRPLLREAVENANTVKMWITLLIPRIEDGNNFGVSIQEEALAEVRTVESEAATFLDQMSRYFMSRARLLTKVAKYPHVDDYRRSILDMDEKQFINIRLVVLEMRNHFSTLHDMIMKNYEKIKKPRNSNTEHLY